MPLLEQIKSSGELRVITRYSPTTYFEGPEGYSGIEYDLIQLFAERMGVRARFILPDNFNQILSLISEGEADIAGWFFELGHLVKSRSEPFILYCAHANRTKVLGDGLVRMGYKKVYELKGGIENGWIKKGKKTQK